MLKIKRALAKMLSLSAVGAMTLSVVSCNEDSQIGESIVNDKAEVVIDSSFVVTGSSYACSAVRSRTITQIIGDVRAPGYGTLKSDVVTQFMPSLSLDTVGISVNEIDSLKLELRMGDNDFVGDSVVPMGIEVYRLNRDLPSPIYSDFDPTGYYDPNDRIGSKIFNFSKYGEADSISKLKYIPVKVDLPVSLAKEIYASYLENPANFSSPIEFAKNVFKGIYIRNSFGSGRLSRVGVTLMQMYYHRNIVTEAGKDSLIRYMGSYMAVTPEIISNNNINLKIDPAIEAAAKSGEPIIMAPTGMEVEINFPIRDIISKYRANITNLGVVNQLTMTLYADTLKNDFGIGCPPNLLLIKKSKKEQFFADNKINDDITSFYATYDTNSKRYVFTGLRSYMLEIMKKDQITDEDEQFCLIPVQVTTETSGNNYYQQGQTYVTAINPYVTQPVMTRLDLKKTRINLIYSKQTITQ